MEKYHPSSLRMLELCPCFVRQEFTDNAKAQQGTRLHKAVETGDDSALEDDGERAMVQNARNFLAAVGQQPKFEVPIETDEIIGTADAVLISENKRFGLLIDWKFGEWRVDNPDINLQIWAYAWGIFHANPLVEEIECAIVYPRMNTAERSLITRMGIPEIIARVRTVIARVEDPNKVPTPEAKACMFCAAKATCKAMQAVVIRQGELLPTPFAYDGSLATPDQRAKAQQLAGLMEDWAKQIKAENTRVAKEEGVEIPGFELKTRAGRRELDRVVEAYDRLSKDNVSLELFLRACKVSLNELTDIASAARGITKKEAKAYIEAKIGDLVSIGDAVTFLQRIKQ